MGQIFSLDFINDLPIPELLRSILRVLLIVLVGGFILLAKFVYVTVPEGSVAVRRRFGHIVRTNGLTFRARVTVAVYNWGYGAFGIPQDELEKYPLVLEHGRHFSLWWAYSIEPVDIRPRTVEVRDIKAAVSTAQGAIISLAVTYRVLRSTPWDIYRFLQGAQDRDALIRSTVSATVVSLLGNSSGHRKPSDVLSENAQAFLDDTARLRDEIGIEVTAVNVIEATASDGSFLAEAIMMLAEAIKWLNPIYCAVLLVRVLRNKRSAKTP